MKVLIVEDELAAKEILAEHLKSEENVEIIGFAENVTDFINKTTRLKPDLVLLDIMLKGQNSLDSLEIIQKTMEEPPFIIVTTAYDDRANREKAQNGYSLAFLSKPIEQEKLASSINFIRKKIKQHENSSEYIQNIIHKKIELRTQVGEFLYVLPEEIVFCTSSGNYTEIYFHNHTGFTLISKNLSWLENKLPEKYFARISRFNIINMKRIRGFSKNSKKIIFDSMENNELTISELTVRKLKALLVEKFGVNFM